MLSTYLLRCRGSVISVLALMAEMRTRSPECLMPHAFLGTYLPNDDKLNQDLFSPSVSIRKLNTIQI